MGELTLLYVHGEQIGYARAGSFMADELVKRGYTVYDDDGYKDARTASQNMREGVQHTAPYPTNLICLVSVPAHLKGYYSGQHVAMLTMWEAMNLPEQFRETFHEFQTMLVPSMQNLELFSEYHDNVHYIPLGVDTARWHYSKPHDIRGEFRFMISGRGERKGVDLTYLAFRKVFPLAKPLKPGMPNPKLIMKSTRGLGEYYAPGVDHVVGKLSPDEESSLYESIHCYVQPSRGEGFGLQPLQAIAMGRPTILTNAHGHASYAHLGIPISAKPAPAAYFIYGDAGMWWEPSLEELCEAMYDVYMNYEAHAERAHANAKIACREFTWQKTTDRFIELMGPYMELDYAGTYTWHKPEPKMFRIITNKDWYGEIGGRSLYFQKDKEYWDSADVKRIFFDAGVLSAECILDHDHGLAPIQVAQIKEYQAHDEVCPTCGQVMDSGVKRSDTIFEELTSGNS